MLLRGVTAIRPLALGFLPPRRTYPATLYTDAADARRASECAVDSASVPPVDLQPNGGFAIELHRR